VYAPRYRAEWLAKITEAGVRRRAEIYYQQFDALAALRQEVRRELLAESRKHPAMRLLRQIPSIGPIRAALLIALMQTPHRFRTKRQLWAYCGLALRTYDSGEYRFVGGQLKRSKKAVTIRGLNKNHNHDLKNIFKGAAARAAAAAGPLQNFYEARIANGIAYSIVRATQFFEFVKGIGDFSTDGNKVRLPSALIQPMAADDVASAVGRIAMGSPVNGTVELGGPEKFRLDELVRRGLAARNDPREVVADPHARYYGVELSERTLVPGDDARLGETRFETWLTQSATKAATVTH
jgi:hypothetical protein